MFRKTKNTTTGIGGVKVYIQSMDGKYKTDSKSFSGGEYYCESLLPGEYRAFLDSSVYSRLFLLPEKDTLFFTIKSKTDGDIIEGIDFVLNERLISKMDTIIQIKDSAKFLTKKNDFAYLFDALESSDEILKYKFSRNIYFRFSDTSLNVAIKKDLDTLSVILKDKNIHSITIEGHSDSRGTMAQNQRISQLRVDIVRKYLIKSGINENIIKTIAYGDSRPVVSNNNEKARAKNRRVEIMVEIRK